MAKPVSLRPASYWRRVVVRQSRSGLTHAEFCRRERLSVHQFHAWKYRHLPALERSSPRAVPLHRPRSASPPAFLPVRVIASAAPIPSAPGAEPFEVLLPGARRLRVPADFDPARLRALLAVLEERPSC